MVTSVRLNLSQYCHTNFNNKIELPRDDLNPDLSTFVERSVLLFLFVSGIIG